MGRLTKTLIEDREKEVIAAFEGGASVKQANEALKLKYDHKMGNLRIYELRDAVRAAKKVAEVTPVETTEKAE
jgi:hypothetical protein